MRDLEYVRKRASVKERQKEWEKKGKECENERKRETTGS